MMNPYGFEAILYEMWQEITLKIQTLISADRATIFLLDEQTNELYSIADPTETGEGFIEFRFSPDPEIIGNVATSKSAVNLPSDFFDEQRSPLTKELYNKTGYRTYNWLALPLLNERGALEAIVQIINKLNSPHNPNATLEEKIDPKGFTPADENIFAEQASEIRRMLSRCRSLYEAVQKQQATEGLIVATRSLSQNNLGLDEIFQLVADSGKQLTNADRCVLWLIDRDRNQLWTKAFRSGTLKKIHIPKTAGFPGKVAQSSEPLIIGFDLYDRTDSAHAKRTDRKFGYRTCSLLCLPVFNRHQELIGVTQLINKKQPGEFPPYNSDDWPKVPDGWKASFNRFDLEFMQAFNIQVGAAVQNARVFATMQQQEILHQEILGGLNNGIIYTDKIGRIKVANDRAKQLLGFGDVCIAIEGKLVRELVRIEAGEFIKWFNAATQGISSDQSQQYYPEQSLISAKGEQYIINLSIKAICSKPGGLEMQTTIPDKNVASARTIPGAIAPDSEATNICGVLIVMDDITQETRERNSAYNYATEELAQHQQDGDTRLEGERRDVTILYSGIRRFTHFLENLEDQEVLQLLKEYFESMTEAVFKYQGTIDKYIGDAIMAIFGSPTYLEDNAWYAVQTALEMRQRLVELNVRRVENGKPAIRIGIGINSDTAIAGNIGSSHHMEFTAIGAGVNLASQLEEESKRYGRDIIISENTYRFCAERIWAREIDLIRIKDTNQPVAIYELVGLRSEEIPEEKRLVIEYYSQGRKYYRDRQFGRAAAAFGQVLEISNWDKAAAIHIERCQYFQEQPPPEDWDGVRAIATAPEDQSAL